MLLRSDNRMRLICQSCKKIYDFSHADIDNFLNDDSLPKGYVKSYGPIKDMAIFTMADVCYYCQYCYNIKDILE